mmetsp:Transcript_3189/g.5993  ORF Transcript_3189/g.5993 Transcript_3189/m.5993 type:complete len:84 (-) Transcript_3189:237-488(-)
MNRKLGEHEKMTKSNSKRTWHYCNRTKHIAMQGIWWVCRSCLLFSIRRFSILFRPPTTQQSVEVPMRLPSERSDCVQPVLRLG